MRPSESSILLDVGLVPDVYSRALRADMGVGEEAESGFADWYYNLNSNVVQDQISAHGEY